MLRKAKGSYVDPHDIGSQKNEAKMVNPRCASITPHSHLALEHLSQQQKENTLNPEEHEAHGF